MPSLRLISEDLMMRYYGGVPSNDQLASGFDLVYFQAAVVHSYGEVKRNRLKELRNEKNNAKKLNRLNNHTEFVKVFPGPGEGDLIASRVDNYRLYFEYPVKPYEALGEFAVKDVQLKCINCNTKLVRYNKTQAEQVICIPTLGKQKSFEPSDTGVYLYNIEEEKVAVILKIIPDDDSEIGDAFIDTDVSLDMGASVFELSWRLIQNRSLELDESNDGTSSPSIFNYKVRNLAANE